MYNERKSKCKSVPCGVPQGSLLAPLLFSLHINDLRNQLNVAVDKGLYADDFQFIIHGKRDDLYDMVFRANDELNNISNWFNARRQTKCL